MACLYGPELVWAAEQNWLEHDRVGTHYIDPASLWQNAYNESFNSIFKGEMLGLEYTCAAWLVQAGVSIREVAELLRHSDIRITMRYAHLAPEQVRTAVERLEPLTSHSGHTESKRLVKGSVSV